MLFVACHLVVKKNVCCCLQRQCWSDGWTDVGSGWLVQSVGLFVLYVANIFISWEFSMVTLEFFYTNIYILMLLVSKWVYTLYMALDIWHVAVIVSQALISNCLYLSDLYVCFPYGLFSICQFTFCSSLGFCFWHFCYLTFPNVQFCVYSILYVVFVLLFGTMGLCVTYSQCLALTVFVLFD